MKVKVNLELVYEVESLEEAKQAGEAVAESMNWDEGLESATVGSVEEVTE